MQCHAKYEKVHHRSWCEYNDLPSITSERLSYTDESDDEIDFESDSDGDDL